MPCMAHELEQDIQPAFIAEKQAVALYALFHGEPVNVYVYREGNHQFSYGLVIRPALTPDATYHLPGVLSIAAVDVDEIIRLLKHLMAQLTAPVIVRLFRQRQA